MQNTKWDEDGQGFCWVRLRFVFNHAFAEQVLCTHVSLVSETMKNLYPPSTSIPLLIKETSVPSTYALGIHTASPDLGFALSNFAGDSRIQVWNLGREVSSYLHVHLADFLQPQSWTDLAFLAVAKGPGGFTGTRLGVVTARTLAQQLDIPLFAISTLAAIADQAEANPNEAIAVQMPAQRGEVFGAIYGRSEIGLQTLLPDTVMPLETWQQNLQAWTTPYHLVQAEGGLGASVVGVLALAEQSWKRGDRPSWTDALPFYGQHPVVLS